ncbi:hypothetical protein GAO09_24900 [Rhizobiales bacterium RZME27]|uniref:Uncharacterized protein n=1 Tax=Endobacterium cereale TaxID=2663029 RepID=A0A6A8AET0_9HYPH|nr:hypothetical protein [Endobacterium cereale]MEB2847430.1 hypothetical protein [Endobacterium cereale]MQY49279.1 hypothetical protein [Endobacterium cereale]
MNEPLRPVTIDRQRLDRALTEAAKRADPVSRAQIEAFENAVRVRRRGSLAHGASLRGEIDQLTMPEITDSGIFGNERSMNLLDHVITAILPNLDANEDVTSIAKAMLEEEIDRRRELQARIDEEGGPE